MTPKDKNNNKGTAKTINFKKQACKNDHGNKANEGIKACGSKFKFSALVSSRDGDRFIDKGKTHWKTLDGDVIADGTELALPKGLTRLNLHSYNTFGDESE